MHEVIPQFTETWLDGKLAEVFDSAVEAIRDMGEYDNASEAVVLGFATALHVFHYEGMSVEDIQHAIWETYHTDHRPALYDQDADVL